MYVGSVVRNHMFVQSEQGGYEYCWIRYRLIRVGWPHGGECGIIGNIVSVSVYDGCKLFANT